MSLSDIQLTTPKILRGYGQGVMGKGWEIFFKWGGGGEKFGQGGDQILLET